MIYKDASYYVIGATILKQKDGKPVLMVYARIWF